MSPLLDTDDLHLSLLVAVVVVASVGEHAEEGNEDGDNGASSRDSPTYAMLIPMDTGLMLAVNSSQGCVSVVERTEFQNEVWSTALALLSGQVATMTVKVLVSIGREEEERQKDSAEAGVLYEEWTGYGRKTGV